VRGGNGPTTIVAGRGVTVLKCDKEDEGEGLEATTIFEARAVEDSITRLGVSTITSEAVSTEAVSSAEVDKRSEGAVLIRRDPINGSKFLGRLDLGP